jgi:hypothetical protein
LGEYDEQVEMAEHGIERGNMTVGEGNTTGVAIGGVEVTNVRAEEKELAEVEGENDVEDGVAGVRASKHVAEVPLVAQRRFDVASMLLNFAE